MKCKYCNSDLLEESKICPNCKKNNEEVMDDFSDLKEKKSGLKYFLIFIIILLLGVIGFGYYYISKPDVVFTTLLNKVYKEALDEEKFNQLKMTANMNIKIDAKEEYKDYTDIINNINLRMIEHIDLTDSTFKIELGADYKEKLLANLNAYYKDNTMYFELKDIVDKIIKVDAKDEMSEDLKFDDSFINDTEVIANNIYEALKLSLKKGTYVSSDAKINGNNVSKNELIINNENKNTLVNTFIDYLLNSEDFISSISKIANKEKQEIIDLLNESKKLEDLKEEIHVSIYTKKLTNEFVKLEISYNKNNISLLKQEDNYKIEINNESNTKIVSNITIDEKNNKLTIVTENTFDDIKVTVNTNISITYNEKLDKPNVENAITIEELSEEDTNNMIENLTKNEGVSEIIESFSKLMPNMTELPQNEMNVEEY